MNTHIHGGTINKTKGLKPKHSKVITSTKNALNDKIEEVLRMDKPLNSIGLTESYLILCRNSFVYRRKVGISSASMELLIYVYVEFKKSGKGVTSYTVSRDYNFYRSELQNCRNKLNKLEDKGLLVKAGFSESGGVVYIPSLRAIEELQSIV